MNVAKRNMDLTWNGQCSFYVDWIRSYLWSGEKESVMWDDGTSSMLSFYQVEPSEIIKNEHYMSLLLLFF